MSLDALVPLLRCPACREPLAYAPVVQRDAEAGECGLLTCGCATYPVLDGVPILTDARLDIKSIGDALVLAPGPTVEEVTARVAEGAGLDALVELLSFPVCPWPLNRFRGARRLSLLRPVRAGGLAARRRRVRAMLGRRERLTAEDWLAAFYWHSPSVYDPFNYFFLRLGQPRHLATLGLLSVLPAAEGPVLDLACGYGHFLHALTVGAGLPAIGIDQNFHQMWVARHYVAPGAAFLCGDADRPLPLADGALSAALVADAFAHLYQKRALLAEFDRTVGDGPVVIASTGNALVPPLEAEELTPDGYAALFGDRPWRVLAEADLLARTLAGQAPDLSRSSAPEAVAASKFLYYLLDPTERLFVDHGPFRDWPHAAGRLAVNPIYRREGDRLHFEFPSTWYAFENRAMAGYMPPTVALPPETASAVARGERTPEVERLLASAAVVGMPARYARAARPLTQRANRLAGTAVARLRRLRG